MSFTLIFEHLYIVLLAALLSLVVGLPLGVISYLSPAVRRPILWVADLLQTVPSLALLGIIMVFLGAGKPTVILGITLYSLLPIVRNTCLGLQEVPAGLKEAARGCGMSRMGQLFQVELPNALPMIFTGIRIAVVNAIGTAVFAAFVSGGGLGGLLTKGLAVGAVVGGVQQITGAMFDLVDSTQEYRTIMASLESSSTAAGYVSKPQRKASQKGSAFPGSSQYWATHRRRPRQPQTCRPSDCPRNS